MGNEPSNPNFRPLTNDEEDIFQANSENINKKVRETFPSIPSDFQLKPVYVRDDQDESFYDFKIAMPDGKLANISFNTNSPLIDVIVGDDKPSNKVPEIKVDPTLTSMLEERIQTVIFY